MLAQLVGQTFQQVTNKTAQGKLSLTAALCLCFLLSLANISRAGTLANLSNTVSENLSDKQIQNNTLYAPTASLDAKNNSATARNFDESRTIRIGFFYLDATVDTLGLKAMHDALTARIDQANQVLANSDINGQFIYNHLRPWPHNDHGSFHDINARTTYNTMAPTIQGLAQSGYLAEYGIDIALLVDYRVNDPYCGWASINTLADLNDKTKTRSYGLIRLGAGCGLDSLALIHELGHLFGAAHGLGEGVTPSDPRGHGYICNGKHTIMHTRHAKHLFFSSPWKEANSELCGTNGQADVQALISDRFHLLAERTNTPETHTTLQVSITETNTPDEFTLIFERFGWVDPSAHFDFHLHADTTTTENPAPKNSDQTVLQRITFAPGELIQTHTITLSANQKDAATLLLINASNIELPFRSNSLQTLDQNNNLAIGYRHEAQTLMLEFSQDIASTSSRELAQWSAVEIDWDDGSQSSIEDFNNPAAITHTYDAPGIYDVRFSGYDASGVFQERTIAVNIGVSSAPISEAFDIENEDTDSSAGNQTNSAGSSGGGTLNHIALLFGILLMVFRKTITARKF